jgi:hypothetical protein
MRLLTHLFRILLLFSIPATALPSLPTDPPLPQALYPSHYDDMLALIQAIEQDALDENCSPEQIEKIADFLSLLAKNGIDPNDSIRCAVLEQDTYTLLCATRSDPWFLTPHYDFYSIQPAVYNGQPDILPCKNWVHKQCSQLKKFVKKHKTAIIIGAAVVAAVTVAVVAIAVIGGTTAASSAAAAAGVAASGLAASEQGDRPPSSSIPQQPLVEALPPDNPEQVLSQLIEEESSSLRAVLIEDSFYSPPDTPDDWAFSEKAREVGAHLAHKILDTAATLGSPIPQFCSEIADVTSRIFPESSTADCLLFSQNTPTENYQETVAFLHEKIDTLFSTDQADLYTPEAKANDPRNDFTLGILPPPGMLGGMVENQKLLQAGQAFDRGGFTRAGRALMKHGYREGSVFPKPVGNPAQVNAHGQQVLEMFLNHPERTVKCWKHKGLGPIMDVEVPGLGGVRFSGDGEKMIGFLQPTSQGVP